MNDEPESALGDESEGIAKFLLSGVAYERGFFFGSSEGTPTVVTLSLDSMQARRAFLLTGKLNLVFHGTAPTGAGVYVGEPDEDLGVPAPINWPASGAENSAPEP